MRELVRGSLDLVLVCVVVDDHRVGAAVEVKPPTTVLVDVPGHVALDCRVPGLDTPRQPGLQMRRVGAEILKLSSQRPETGAARGPRASANVGHWTRIEPAATAAPAPASSRRRVTSPVGALPTVAASPGAMGRMVQKRPCARVNSGGVGPGDRDLKEEM